MTRPTVTCTVNLTGHQWNLGACLFCAEPQPVIPLLTDEQRAEIQARWAAVPSGEQPSISVAGSSRPGALLSALLHAREDVPALLAHLELEERESAHQRAERIRKAAELDLLRSALAEITTVLASRGEGPTGDALLDRIAGIVRRVEAAGGGDRG